MGYRILLLDVTDPPDVDLGIRLGQCGFTIDAAADLGSAVCLQREHAPALTVIRIADGDAVDLPRALPVLAAAPVVVICTARDADLVVRCLEAGADTVLVASLSRRELGSRIRAAVGWPSDGPASEAWHPSQPYRVGDLVVDPDSHAVTKAGLGIALTPTEFRLLAALARRAGETVCHADLVSEVWGTACAKARGNLRLYIRYLRRKLENHCSRPSLLVNQRGVGYRLAADAT